MKNLRGRTRTIPPAVPTASMADIAFLLIIFFMLTTSFSPEKTTIDLPESSIRVEVSQEAAVIAVTPAGEIFYTEGIETSFQLSGPEELGILTQEIIRIIPDKQFVLKADRMVDYQAVDEVLEQLRNNGARHIGFLTEAKTSEII